MDGEPSGILLPQVEQGGAQVPSGRQHGHKVFQWNVYKLWGGQANGVQVGERGVGEVAGGAMSGDDASLDVDVGGGAKGNGSKCTLEGVNDGGQKFPLADGQGVVVVADGDVGTVRLGCGPVGIQANRGVDAWVWHGLRPRGSKAEGLVVHGIMGMGGGLGIDMGTLPELLLADLCHAPSEVWWEAVFMQVRCGCQDMGSNWVLPAMPSSVPVVAV